MALAQVFEGTVEELWVRREQFTGMHLRVFAVPPTASVTALTETLNKLTSLKERPEGWNGYDVAAPHPEAIRQAQQWIESLYREVSAHNLLWLPPHVTSDEEGNAVFEWQQGKNELTVYVLPEGVEYVRAFPKENGKTLDDGELHTAEECYTLWQWLLEG